MATVSNNRRLKEVGDFEAQNSLPAMNLIQSTKLHLTTEPPISCSCCYHQLLFKCFIEQFTYSIKFQEIIKVILPIFFKLNQNF